MSSITEVARYILERQGRMTTMKLEKLAFYAQARSLAMTGKPIFDEDFEAWAGGPVSPELFGFHRGRFSISAADLRVPLKKLPDSTKHIVDSTCDSLGGLTGNQLSEKTHREDPWKITRGETPLQSPSSAIISKNIIAQYYSSHPHKLEID
ncbi:type II toxin-antitoxin system antitoxin SocA domain-containing protein [Bifidobacterium mongoliense]|jgi:uncharacterized phage-associated protein|uniref:Panacea domain-containing protein n=1 Tax=Bifidobacterium mongoliense TaxID=518643 RepID=UPI0030F3BD65